MFKTLSKEIEFDIKKLFQENLTSFLKIAFGDWITATSFDNKSVNVKVKQFESGSVLLSTQLG